MLRNQTKTNSNPSKLTKKATPLSKRTSKKASAARKQSQRTKTQKTGKSSKNSNPQKKETKTLRTFYITESNRELLVEYKQKQARNFDWQVNCAIKYWFASGNPY